MRARARRPASPPRPSSCSIDPDGGKSMAIVLFDTEDDMRQGDETLNSMTPSTTRPAAALGEMYEVGVDVRV